ncbi:MAG: hypothetical protein A2Y62_22155 [Candidatus Fischerbacteria bacterium RBG_13_37_8]|uniref:Uncharacterized protein n=1 Tax=Candidatus Fischerbacteria bacterium RBG_13_37_8 TaxID=1817863 RepID=A0A1F5VJD1_9BACT|nr:MAG: hypothetical protein A2Y62_22155 [Candidatus Fischerbacteria bacterium RBG_13_37_8]
MKGKSWYPDQVKEQIETGWSQAQKIVQDISKVQLTLIPILLKKRSKKSIAVKQLKSYRINKQSIIQRDCGSSLSEILKIMNV